MIRNLTQVNLIDLPYGLSFQETKNLWTQAAIDGNGVASYEQFLVCSSRFLSLVFFQFLNFTCGTCFHCSNLNVQQRLRSFACSEQTEENVNGRTDACNEEEVVGFKVKHAVLFPREVEIGTWPDGYSLSDHARLRVEFSPVMLQCS